MELVEAYDSVGCISDSNKIDSQCIDEHSAETAEKTQESESYVSLFESEKNALRTENLIKIWNIKEILEWKKVF